jgi:hypothetical protein
MAKETKSFPSSGQLAPNPATGRTYFPSRGWADGQISALKEATVIGKEKPTLSKQNRTPRFDAECNPLEIMFVTGKHPGLILDIGLNIQEFSESQSAEWADAQGTNIKVGSNFVKISPRTFSFKFEFSDLTEDIRQLTEAVAHTHELHEETWTPPLLRIVIGKSTIFPVVCTQFDINIDEPLPKKGGFRHGVVSMSLKEIAGQGSIGQMGAPLLSAKTALQSYAANTSEQDKAQIGQNRITKVLLAPCLGEEASSQIADLVQNKQLDDITRLESLPGEIFLNLVTAGLISPETLKKPQITEKLKRDLAEKLAKDAPGLNPINIREVAQALYTGQPNALPPSLMAPIPGKNRSQFEQLLGDYQAILAAMQEQKLNEADPIFGKGDEKGAAGKVTPTSAKTLIDSFSCAISMRRSGSPSLATKSNESDTKAIDGINQALANQKLTDSDVAKMFGLAADTPETVIRQIRNSGPYKTKEDFLAKLANSRNGITGYVLWQNFDTRDKENLATINKLIVKEGLTDEEISKAFRIPKDSEMIAIIRNGGKPFKSKQEFIDKMTKPGQPPDPTRGYQAWETFWKNELK